MSYNHTYVGTVDTVSMDYSDESRLTRFYRTTPIHPIPRDDSTWRRLNVALQNHNYDGRE